MPLKANTADGSGPAKAKAKAKPEAKPEAKAKAKVPAYHDNLIFLNILEHGFNISTGLEVADVLGTNETKVSRVRTGDADIAGLAPEVLGRLFPGLFEIALRAQLMEFNLRKHHARVVSKSVDGNTPSPEELEALRDEISKGWKLLFLLRQWLREMRRPTTHEKRLEREIDRAALASLEGQLYLYDRKYADAAVAFEKVLSYFDIGQVTDLGSRVLITRSTLNWYFAKDKCNINVSSSVMQKVFVDIARNVASITGDSRLLFPISEAHGVNDKNFFAAELLCDAAAMLDVQAADLSKHQPVGYEKPLGLIPAFKKALGLVEQVEARRRNEQMAKLAARCDVRGSLLGSLPDDASLNLSGF